MWVEAQGGGWGGKGAGWSCQREGRSSPTEVPPRIGLRMEVGVEVNRLGGGGGGRSARCCGRVLSPSGLGVPVGPPTPLVLMTHVRALFLSLCAIAVDEGTKIYGPKD